MILAFNVQPLWCTDSFKVGLSKDIKMSMYMWLIEAGAVDTACSVVSHISQKQKVKSGVKNRTDIYSFLREDIQVL